MSSFNIAFEVPTDMWKEWSTLEVGRSYSEAVSQNDTLSGALFQVKRKSGKMELSLTGRMEELLRPLNVHVSCNSKTVNVRTVKDPDVMNYVKKAGTTSRRTKVRLSDENNLFGDFCFGDVGLNTVSTSDQLSWQYSADYYVSDDGLYYLSTAGDTSPESVSSVESESNKEISEKSKTKTQLSELNTEKSSDFNAGKLKPKKKRKRKDEETSNSSDMSIIVNKYEVCDSSQFLQMRGSVRLAEPRKPRETQMFVTVKKSDIRCHNKAAFPKPMAPAEEHVICEHCGKKLSSYPNLCWHRRLKHNIGKPINYKYCNICGRKFAKSAMFNKHIASHTGDKRNKCDVCGRAYYFRGDMLRHRRFMHEGKDTYTCEKCGYGFNRKDRLRKHRCGVTRRPRRDLEGV